ncbi:MAG: hypothetical protein QM811_30720 [Pirellulales bacterium]
MPTLVELVVLFVAGATAAVCMAFVRLRLGIPGHVIVWAILPIAAGVAFAPRRLSGTLAGLGAVLTVGFLSMTGNDVPQPAAATGLFAFGPLLDVVRLGVGSSKIRLIPCTALAGLLANTLAYFVRLGLNVFELDLGMTHVLSDFGWSVYAKFAACGFVVGVIGGMLLWGASKRRAKSSTAAATEIGA